MVETRSPSQTRSEPEPLIGLGARWIVLALVVRVPAALLVDAWARSRGQLCLFDDTRVYWHLAGQIRAGLSYMVPQYGVPHFALRTPGYPLFLAVCRVFFGESTLAPRLLQAVLGAASVGLLVDLVRRTVGPVERGRLAAGWAGLIGAIEPFSAGLSVLLLSEALFVPLVLLALCGLERLTRTDTWSAGKLAVAGIGSGVVQGATVLVRPSWLLFVPLAAVWVAVATRAERWPMRGTKASLLLLGFALAMAPWWVRNEVVFGRFVPSALWLGASLYDGLNPAATGASDMRFLDDPEIRSLDETSQDRVLRERALAFVREHPTRALQLAGIKLARFWSLWPNAQELRNPLVAAASLVVTLPLYALMGWGAWIMRSNGRALWLMAAPLAYVALLHLVFVGSIRYRIAAEVPALGLAAVALTREE
jgi:4-amino-4-deoxy-L-arabinose transferase-like glycosyltransferase